MLKTAPKIRYKTLPHPNGGWYAVELTGKKETWRSSNYAEIECCDLRIKQRKALRDNTTAWKQSRRPSFTTGGEPQQMSINEKRVKRSYKKCIDRFNAYIAQGEPLEWFKLDDMYRVFGLHSVAVKRLVAANVMPPPDDDKSKPGKTVWRFSLKTVSEFIDRITLLVGKE